jgi:glucose-6-phosphate isomerase
MSAGIEFHLGVYEAKFLEEVEKANKAKLVERIWRRDHTVWNPNSEEIENRLGWLDVAKRMRLEVPRLQKLKDQVVSEGFIHVLLLGMGGSSLAPEVFSKLLATKDGLKLSVLDSTDPGAVSAKAAEFDPAKTLYIVSTKSGGTVETLSFFKFFYTRAKEKLGDKAGQHFIAITDPGSSLADLAAQHSFRHTFLADPNIGGRYSALSHFGLVPAALVSVDLGELIGRAEGAAAACRQPAPKNPGALLGLALGTLANAGVDKATFVSPAGIADFGNWVEQLIAESTGKNGKGILPVVGEQLASLDAYGEDRVFIALGRLEGEAAALIAAAKSAKRPVIELAWPDPYVLGWHFFAWEFATAIAGHVLAIHPFDQPNVEAAKVQGRSFIDEYSKTGKLAKGEFVSPSVQALSNFISAAKPGDYIALQAFVDPTAKVEDALQDLRAALLNKSHLATTLGYGPRFLHSTGQLHKGDAGRGLFIQFVTPPPQQDIAIPKSAGSAESELSFGVLKVAQAMGDAQALRQAGRRVLSFEIEGDSAAEISKLARELS